LTDGQLGTASRAFMSCLVLNANNDCRSFCPNQFCNIEKQEMNSF